MAELICCCCGGAAPALLQWWNRDTGFALCGRCAARCHRAEPAEFAKCYGVDGLHWFSHACPYCAEPGTYVRTRYFSDGTTRELALYFMCGNEQCRAHRLYYVGRELCLYPRTAPQEPRP